MERNRLFRACLVTQWRTVERRFSPGPKREAWLAWLEKVAADGRLPISDALRDALPKLG